MVLAVENDVRITTEALVMTDGPPVMAHPAAVVPVLAALSALGTLATNILLPSLPGIGASLHVSTAATTQLITVFLGIFAVGQLVVGPLSDRYGRRVPVLIGFAASFGETHRAERSSVHIGFIGGGYLELLRDRRFIVPATTVAFIMGGLFSMFSAAPRVMIELMAFRPIEVGFFFAGTVFVV